MIEKENSKSKACIYTNYHICIRLQSVATSGAELGNRTIYVIAMFLYT